MVSLMERVVRVLIDYGSMYVAKQNMCTCWYSGMRGIFKADRLCCDKQNCSNAKSFAVFVVTNQYHTQENFGGGKFGEL